MSSTSQLTDKQPHFQIENKVLLNNISWVTYESLLIDLADESNLRLTYDNGKLEIMSPPSEHERIKHLLELIIELIGLEINIDLSNEPAPDLIIEVDISSPSLDKFPIYAQVGVTEIWRYDGVSLTFHLLSGTSYLVSSNSLAFPFVTSQIINSFLEESRTTKKTSLLKHFSNWIKEQNL